MALPTLENLTFINTHFTFTLLTPISEWNLTYVNRVNKCIVILQHYHG